MWVVAVQGTVTVYACGCRNMKSVATSQPSGFPPQWKISHTKMVSARDSGDSSNISLAKMRKVHQAICILLPCLICVLSLYIHFVYLFISLNSPEKMNMVVSAIMCVPVLFSYCNVLRKEEGSARWVRIVCYMSFMCLLFHFCLFICLCLFLFLFFTAWMLKIQHETRSFVMCPVWCVQKWRWRWQRRSPRGWSQGRGQTVRAASPSAFTFLLNIRPIHPNPPTPQFLLRTAPRFLLTSCECRMQYTQDLGREGRGKGAVGVQTDE